MKLLIGLAVALAASIAGNAVLGWQLAKSRETCRADMVTAARIAIENERDRAADADREAGKIAHETAADTRNDTVSAEEKTHAREHAIRQVVVTGACRMPDGLPELQPAIDAANAAAGD